MDTDTATRIETLTAQVVIHKAVLTLTTQALEHPNPIHWLRDTVLDRLAGLEVELARNPRPAHAMTQHQGAMTPWP